MSVFRFFSFSNNNVLSCRNLLCSRHTLKSCEEQRALLSGKALEKLGIPLPPKRPLSPYLRFSQIIRPTVVKDQTNTSPHETLRLIAQEWSKYDPEKKKLLQKEYLSEMQIYLSNSEKYKQSITQEQKNLIASIKQKQKRAKEQARITEKKESLGKPKRPPSAFIKFMLDKKDQKDDNVKHSEWIRKVAVAWEHTSDYDKEKYREEAKIALEKYKTELLAWEENMIRKGHLDVVRNKELLDITYSKKKSSKTTI